MYNEIINDELIEKRLNESFNIKDSIIYSIDLYLKNLDTLIDDKVICCEHFFGLEKEKCHDNLYLKIWKEFIGFDRENEAINVDDVKEINVDDIKQINVDDVKQINVDDVKQINVDDIKQITVNNLNTPLQYGKSYMICRHFRNGLCMTKDCKFEHPSTLPLESRMCKQFIMNGFCKFRKRCPHLHEKKLIPCLHHHIFHTCTKSFSTCSFSHVPIITRSEMKFFNYVKSISKITKRENLDN